MQKDHLIELARGCGSMEEFAAKMEWTGDVASFEEHVEGLCDGVTSVVRRREATEASRKATLAGDLAAASVHGMEIVRHAWRMVGLGIVGIAKAQTYGGVLAAPPVAKPKTAATKRPVVKTLPKTPVAAKQPDPIGLFLHVMRAAVQAAPSFGVSLTDSLVDLVPLKDVAQAKLVEVVKVAPVGKVEVVVEPPVSTESEVVATPKECRSEEPPPTQGVPAPDELLDLVACKAMHPDVVGLTGAEYCGRKVVKVRMRPGVFGREGKEHVTECTLHNGMINHGALVYSGTGAARKDVPSMYWVLQDQMAEARGADGKGVFTKKQVVDAAVAVLGEERRDALGDNFDILKTHQTHKAKRKCGYSYYVFPGAKPDGRPDGTMTMHPRRVDEDEKFHQDERKAFERSARDGTPMKSETRDRH